MSRDNVPTLDRRTLIRSAALAALSVTRPAAAQIRPAATIGFLGGGTPPDSAQSLLGLREGLEALGYAEPATLRILTRYAEGDLSRLPALIGDLERAGAEVLVAHAQATLPAVRAPRTRPLVFSLSADPVSLGITSELSRPQHNATGVTLLAAELNLKRVEILREIMPGLQRLGVVYNPQHGGQHLERDWVDRGAAVHDMRVTYLTAGDPKALEDVVSRLRGEPPEAIMILSDGFMLTHRRTIMSLADSLRIPVVAGWGVFAEAGALCTYGPRLSDIARRPAVFVDRILRGAKAADLPIERPTSLELVINLDTAQRLGLTLPPAVLGRADRVVG